MPKAYPLQESFSAGELSPLMYARTSTDGYKAGALELTNTYADSRGPGLGRPGFRWYYSENADYGRAETFQISKQKFRTLVFTNLKLTVNDPFGSAVEETFVTPWPEAEIEYIHTAEAPGGTVVYFFHGKYETQKLTYDPILDTFTFTGVTFTAPPASWTGSNWPSTGTFYQGRMWAAGTPDQGETFWASKSADYENFTTGTLDDDAIEFTLEKYGEIEWIGGQKSLAIGTENGEHIVTSETGIITPSDIQVDQQSSYGSNTVQQEKVGDQIFYISPDGKKIRSMSYQWQEDNWLSRDLTFISEHITKPKVRDVAWQQDPKNLFWTVLNNGELACVTYERGNNIYGWHGHDTKGEFQSLAVAEYFGTSVLVATVKRLTGKVYTEIMWTSETSLDVDSIESEFYFDSWVKGTVTGGTGTEVTGLDHLEGEDVQVITDDGAGGKALHPNRTVTGGKIDLQWDATDAWVGLQYIPVLETLPVEVPTQQGSSIGSMRHHAKIYVRLLESGNPIINGQRPPSRSPSTPMNTAEPIRSYDARVQNLGRDRTVRIRVEQDLPLPMNVGGIFSDMAMERV